MNRQERIEQIRNLSTGPRDAICMILSACTDMGWSNGPLLSGDRFNEVAEMIVVYFGLAASPPYLCPNCGDDRTNKGSLITADGQAFCNELCYDTWRGLEGEVKQ